MKGDMQPPSNPSDPTPVPALCLRPLETRRYPIPGFGVVKASLWAMRPRPGGATPTAYAIRLEGLGRRHTRLLGRDYETAKSLFELLVKNTVTPCALSDVLEELIG